MNTRADAGIKTPFSGILFQLITRPLGHTIRGNMSATSVLVSYDYQIVDEDAVLRDLCCPDIRKIKARHHSGVKIIPGILITPKPYTSTKLD